MDLTIQQGDLSFAVGRALGSVSNKSPLPLLSCVLLEADKAGLRVTGTDLDVTTSVVVPCTVKSPGKAAVSARHFNDVVRKMPKGPLALAVRANQCEITYGDGKGWSRFPTQDPADFPRIPELGSRWMATRSPGWPRARATPRPPRTRARNSTACCSRAAIIRCCSSPPTGIGLLAHPARVRSMDLGRRA